MFEPSCQGRALWYSGITICQTSEQRGAHVRRTAAAAQPGYRPGARDGQRQRRALSAGHDLLGRAAARRPAPTRARPRCPPGHLAYDPPPSSQGPGEHRLHRHHPRIARAARGSATPTSLSRCWNQWMQAARGRTGRHLRVPHDGGVEAGRPCRRAAHREDLAGHGARQQQASASRRTGRRCSAPTSTSTGP